MNSALKTLVCVAIVLASTVASEERKKRADYGDTLSAGPWQSPTSWGSRPYNNYYNIPSTRISRVNNYNPYQNGGSVVQRNQVRNSGQPSDLYNNREQSSGWIPITPNSNKQNYGGRYGQNGQRQQGYSRYNNAYNTINVEEQLLNGRTRQRQPSYSVQRNRGNDVNTQASRSINGKLLIQSNQIPSQSQLYRNLNQEERDYLRQSINLNNREPVPQPGRVIKTTYLSRIIPGQIQGENIPRTNLGYPEQQRNQPIGGLDQQTLRHFSGSYELPVVEGRFLGVNIQQATPEVEPDQTNVEPNQQVLRVVNPEHLIRSSQLPVVQGQILVENPQQAPSGYAVEEIINEPRPLNQQALRLVNSDHLIGSSQHADAQRGNSAASVQQETPLSVQVLNQPNVGLKQSSGLLNSEILRAKELEALREQYLSNNIQQNNQESVNSEQEVDSSADDGRYSQTLAFIKSRPIFNPNQLPAVQGQFRDNLVNQQYLHSLNQPSSQVLKLISQSRPLNINNNGRSLLQSSGALKSDSSLLSSQSPNEEWRQGRLSALRNNGGSNGIELTARNPNFGSDTYQTQEVSNQNDANQQQDVYTYAELTAKIWKLIKSNPAMMSNLQNLREQLLNGRNSRNEQMRELEGLLQEARKYGRNSAISATNSARESLEQQKRDAFVTELIDTMNKNDIASNSLDSIRQIPYNGNDRSNQPRYIVRPAGVNPIIKNILFSTARRNETLTQNTSSVPSAGIVFRPNTNIPLPQLEVSEPFGLEQLDHHYDLTQWKRITETLKENPFLQPYNLLEHLG